MAKRIVHIPEHLRFPINKTERLLCHIHLFRTFLEDPGYWYCAEGRAELWQKVPLADYGDPYWKIYLGISFAIFNLWSQNALEISREKRGLFLKRLSDSTKIPPSQGVFEKSVINHHIDQKELELSNFVSQIIDSHRDLRTFSKVYSSDESAIIKSEESLFDAVLVLNWLVAVLKEEIYSQDPDECDFSLVTFGVFLTLEKLLLARKWRRLF